MLPSSHLLNGVGIAVTSLGFSFHWWRWLSPQSACDKPPPNPQQMSGKWFGLTQLKLVGEEGCEEEQEEEVLLEAFIVAFAGGNEHFAVSVQDLPALTVCVCINGPVRGG